MLSSWRVIRYIFRAGPKDRNSKFDWERKRRKRERRIIKNNKRREKKKRKEEKERRPVTLQEN